MEFLYAFIGVMLSGTCDYFAEKCKHNIAKTFWNSLCTALIYTTILYLVLTICSNILSGLRSFFLYIIS